MAFEQSSFDLFYKPHWSQSINCISRRPSNLIFSINFFDFLNFEKRFFQLDLESSFCLWRMMTGSLSTTRSTDVASPSIFQTGRQFLNILIEHFLHILNGRAKLFEKRSFKKFVKNKVGIVQNNPRASPGGLGSGKKAPQG